MIRRALKNNRLCKSLTGLNITKFYQLAVQFEQIYLEDQHQKSRDRKRKIGGGRTAVLREAIDKLFFILMYLKVYPTFDVLSFIQSLDRSECCRWVHRLMPILEKTLGRACVLPERQINSPEEFLRKFPKLKDIFIDGTERKVQRPVNPKRRKKLYSGKKKSMTRKNIVASDENRKVLYLSKSQAGRRHDKKLGDKMGVSHIPKDVAIWVDLGFKGIDHPNVVIPHKKPKGGSLTEAQKQDNKLISGIRVLSEHAISGIKRLNSTSHTYRNRKINVDDTFTLLASGIWNYHLLAA